MTNETVYCHLNAGHIPGRQLSHIQYASQTVYGIGLANWAVLNKSEQGHAALDASKTGSSLMPQQFTEAIQRSSFVALATVLVMSESHR